MITRGSQGVQRESRLSRYTSIGFILIALALGAQSAASAAASKPFGGTSDSSGNAAAASVHVNFAQSPQSTARPTRGQLSAVRITGFPQEAAGKTYRVVVGKSDGTSVMSISRRYTGQTAMDLPLTSAVDPGAIVFVTVSAS